MTYLDYDMLHRAPVENDPYPFLLASDVLRRDRLAGVLADFPDVPGAGSHPPGVLNIGGDFKGLVDELHQPAFRRIIENKFHIDLADRPTMYTVRGYCRRKDGRIHRDSETKLITVLLYLNQEWSAEGGRLRLLRSRSDMDDFVQEISPDAGKILIFRRGENSWHGHRPFEGARRAIQLNWVTSADVVAREQGRHRVSNILKRWRL